jgi:very-short-patch-repair endonuclease
VLAVSPRAQRPTLFGMPVPAHPIGAVVASQNPATSQIEQHVLQRLLEGGLAVRQGLAIQCGYDGLRNLFPVLTPDFVIDGTTVCVEVDPVYTHGGRELQDVMRNALLTQVGWTVVRLRLGGQKAVSRYDVIAEGEAITDEVITALVAAVADAVAGRPPTIRKVAKPASRVQGRLSQLNPRSSWAGARFCTWTLDTGETVRLAVMDSGRYLGLDKGKGGVWCLRLLHLHRTPRNRWRGELETLLEQMRAQDFAPVSAFPWGDRFFTGPSGPNVVLPASFNLGGQSCELILNATGVTAWTPRELRAGDTTVLRIHAESVAAGWRIAGAAQAPFLPGILVVTLARTGDRTGHWA